MRKIQFDTLRTLTTIYEDAGLRGSFNAEVMQQLIHLRCGEQHPELLEFAREWSHLLCATYARGHDVQLHIHPQWHAAQYVAGRWLLAGDWTLGNHPPERIHQMLDECTSYVQDLLKPINPDYRCVTFRAGAWALAPSPHTVKALIAAGIQVDISIAPGMVKTGEVAVDYSRVQRQFLPYYPKQHDARLVAREPQPLVCVPTFTFYYTQLHKVRDTLDRIARRQAENHSDASQTLAIRLKSFVRRHATRTHYVSDLSTLTYPQMQRMLDEARRHAASAGGSAFPVVLTNHTKDLREFEPIRKFAKLLAAADDIEVITLAQLAANIQRGKYLVRTAGPPVASTTGG